MTKSGTSAKGLILLELKPNGTAGGPLYPLRYNGSAPAVYITRLSEQVALSLRWMFSPYQVWKVVLLATASVRVEAG